MFMFKSFISVHQCHSLVSCICDTRPLYLATMSQLRTNLAPPYLSDQLQQVTQTASEIIKFTSAHRATY